MNKLEKNPIKQKIMNGETIFGIYIAVPSPIIVELAGYSGYDFVRIDISHMSVDLQSIENMVRAAELTGVVPMVRVDNNPHLISMVLEMGVQGLVVPDVESIEIAKSVVDASRFNPVGKRGIFSVPRVSHYGNISGEEYTKWSNNELLLGIQIENIEAVNYMEEILDIEGIDMCLSGRGDLANSLGVPGQKNHPLVLEAEEKIFESARKHGKSISVQLNPTAHNFRESLKKWKDRGAQVITLGHDIPLIKNALENTIAIARET
jgi:4-hydroxy-2-oxoheptanedioate aldolase